MSKKFRALVLGGGGIKGFSHLGVLNYYVSNHSLEVDLLEEAVGTSVGALICLLLLCGYTPQELYSYFFSIDNLVKFSKGDIWNIFTKRGLVDISSPFGIIENMVIDKLGRIPTMKEFYNLNKVVFKVTVSNYTKLKVEYLNYRTNPDLPITEAVKMSCCLPPIFQSISYQNNIYIDGGMADNFPIDGLDNKNGDVLALAITTIYTKDDDSFIDYTYKVMIFPSEILSSLRIDKTPKNMTLIKICLKNISTVDFSVSKEIKANLFNQGERDAKTVESKKCLKIWDWSFHDHWDDNFVIY